MQECSTNWKKQHGSHVLRALNKFRTFRNNSIFSLNQELKPPQYPLRHQSTIQTLHISVLAWAFQAPPIPFGRKRPEDKYNQRTTRATFSVEQRRGSPKTMLPQHSRGQASKPLMLLGVDSSFRCRVVYLRAFRRPSTTFGGCSLRTRIDLLISMCDVLVKAP